MQLPRHQPSKPISLAQQRERKIILKTASLWLIPVPNFNYLVLSRRTEIAGAGIGEWAQPCKPLSGLQMKVEDGWAQRRPTGPFIPKCNAHVSACGNNLDSNLGSKHHLELVELGESLPDQTMCWSSTREFSKSLHVFDLSSKVCAFRTEGHEVDQREICVLLLNRQRHWTQFCILSHISNMIILPGTSVRTSSPLRLLTLKHGFLKGQIRTPCIFPRPLPPPDGDLASCGAQCDLHIRVTRHSSRKEESCSHDPWTVFPLIRRLWWVHVMSCDHAASPLPSSYYIICLDIGRGLLCVFLHFVKFSFFSN